MEYVLQLFQGDSCGTCFYVGGSPPQVGTSCWKQEITTEFRGYVSVVSQSYVRCTHSPVFTNPPSSHRRFLCLSLPGCVPASRDFIYVIQHVNELGEWTVDTPSKTRGLLRSIWVDIFGVVRNRHRLYRRRDLHSKSEQVRGVFNMYIKFCFMDNGCIVMVTTEKTPTCVAQSYPPVLAF